MATYLLRHVPSDLIRRAKARAKEIGESLDERLLAYLRAYAEGETPRDHGAKGGMTRAQRLTAEERSESARRAVQHRWARKDQG